MPDKIAPMTWEEVWQEEIAVIKKRRQLEEPAQEHLVGLALSGGGIRSATFALGVLESLKAKGLLKQVDYLSSVSGGGYVAAWLGANCKRAAARRAAAEVPSPDPAVDVVHAHGEHIDAAPDWLDQDAKWNESIKHLRRYSNYLAPQVGFFSADTWVMATIWLRNTLLVQLTLILAFAAILLLPRPLFSIFEIWSKTDNWRWTTVVLFVIAIVGIAGNLLRINRNGKVLLLRSKNWIGGLLLATALFIAAAALIMWSDFDPFTNHEVDLGTAAPVALLLVWGGFFMLPAGVRFLGAIWLGSDPPRQINYTQGWVQVVVIIPLILTGYLLAAVLWGQTVDHCDKCGLHTFAEYGEFVTKAWRYWSLPLMVAASSLWLFSFCSIHGSLSKRSIFFTALLAPLPAVAVLHILLCVIMLIFHVQAQSADQGIWFAFVWGPPMVLYAFALAIVMLIGMMGRQSTEGVREWWSRMGAWLCIYGFAWMLIMVAAVYGPLWATRVFNGTLWEQSPLLAWLGTTLAGLWAGKSGATGGTRNGEKLQKSNARKSLDLVAKIGPFFFIAGLLILISTAVHIILLGLANADWSMFSELSQLHWAYMKKPPMTIYLGVIGASVILLLVMAARIDINEFSLNAFYRSRLARCYLGATNFLVGERKPQKFTGFDEGDDMRMGDLGNKDAPTGPLHIVNCALNLGGSSDLSLHTRHSAGFTFTPYTAGSSYQSKDLYGNRKVLGYRPISSYGGSRGHPTLAQVTSVSGAAASPNMGYHTSPVVAFLLTVFNVRLGWWFPNPIRADISSPSPLFSLRYLVKELFGGADDKSSYLMLSDGGHFENLGVYELIRRQCRVIIVSDAECDPELQFESLGSLIRMCEVDLGVKISLNVREIRHRTSEPDWSAMRSAVGDIDYGDGKPKGILIYLKASMTGAEDTSIRQYQDAHPAFPHESTGNQFYGEDQFESYRRLGREIAESAFGADANGKPIELLAAELRETQRVREEQRQTDRRHY